MECLHRPIEMGRTISPVVKYNEEKITKIREKIELVFGRASTWDDMLISQRYNLTGDGDLVMILR